MIERETPTRRRRSDDSGAISVMAAVLVAAMVMATSLAVDVGRVAYTSRDQQGVTDRAVLDALRRLPEWNLAAGGPSDVWQAARNSVLTTLEGNLEGSAVGTSSDRAIDLLEVGYVDASCPGPNHFCVMWDGAATTYTGQWGVETIDTLRLSTHSDVDFVFGFLDEEGERDVFREATGTNRRICVPGDPACPQQTLVDAEAGISVASRLVELDADSSPVLEPVISSLVGSGTTLTLVGFDGLATADVPLSVLGDAGADIGSPDQLLASRVVLADLLDAMIAGLSSDDAAVAADATTALSELRANVDPALQVDIEDFLVATTEDEALLEAEFPVLDLLLAAAMAAAVADGEHLIDVDLASADLLGLDGLLGVDLQLTIVEAPQLAYGKVVFVPEDDADGDGLIDPGEQAHYQTRASTAQIAADVTLTIDSSKAEALLGPIEDLLSGLLCTLLASLCPDKDVTISVAAAQAEAQLVAIDCTDPVEESDVTTVVSSDAVAASVSEGDVTLVGQRNGSTTYGVPGEAVTIDTVPGLEATTDASVSGVAALDAVLGPVLSLLGISTGTAYVGAHDVRCDVPVLLPNALP